MTVKLFANYQFSLTGKEGQDWQMFLRALPEQVQQHPMWRMLHELSYTSDYTQDGPKYHQWKAGEGFAPAPDPRSAKAGK